MKRAFRYRSNSVDESVENVFNTATLQLRSTRIKS